MIYDTTEELQAHIPHAIAGQFTIAEAGANSIQASITGTFGLYEDLEEVEIFHGINGPWRIFCKNCRNYGEAFPAGLVVGGDDRPTAGYSGVLTG